MTFAGLEELPGSSTSKNGDGTFTLEIQLGMITAENAGDYTLTVQLGDANDA